MKGEGDMMNTVSKTTRGNDLLLKPKLYFGKILKPTRAETH